MHAQKFLAQRLLQARQARPRVEPHLVEKDGAREGISVGVQSVGGQPEHGVPEADAPTVDDLFSIYHAHDAPRQIVVRALVNAGHLRRLTADQRTTRRAAGGGQTLQNLCEHRRLQLTGTDVVEEKQRTRAEHRDVVDAVVDEVLADGVVLVERDGQLELGADAVDARHEHRLAHALEIRAEQAAESARLAEHFRPVGGLELTAQPALETVAEINVHAGPGVGFLRGGHRALISPRARTQSPGSPLASRAWSSARSGRGFCRRARRGTW